MELRCRQPQALSYYLEAVAYTHTHFSENPGTLSDSPLYPTNFEEADRWLGDFLENRFHGFGPYEDSIVANESILHHSVLSPLLNAGLLEPGHVLERILAFAEQHDVPLNSTEGLVRQLLGWREFVRGVYEYRGRQQRTSNRLGHTRALPASFYDGTTGIPPIDQTIRKLLKTGYVHHIERLMVLSSFMNLCGFHPNAVYQWFMELFIDAYDWVMVPNVYGMALFADGGMMSTKPYVSGSNYIRKMSDYKPGDWENIWDALFWTFMDRHRPVFGKNPRLSVLMSHWDNMDPERKAMLVEQAEVFLSRQSQV
jgi:deoxyribodipyrimidine photolyase-related protein